MWFLNKQSALLRQTRQTKLVSLCAACSDLDDPVLVVTELKSFLFVFLCKQ